MNNKVNNLAGQVITARSGNKYSLTTVADSGAQGVVYEEASGRYMIKLYYPSDALQLDNDIIDKLAFIKNVKKPRNFVEIHDIIDNPYIGYVMDRVIGHKNLNAYLIPSTNMKMSEWYNSGFGFRGRLFLGYLIAKAFRSLSAENLAYCDISGNNILVRIDKNETSVRMIDIDNIYIAGRGEASVLGTPRYIAPEIINKSKNPDVFSDNYSLAVILFELLRIGHPYVSDQVIDGTPEEEDAAYAGKVDYVTDKNSSNMLPADIAFTEKLKGLFERCFVVGKENRMERPTAKEFEFALLEASNKVTKCPTCGAWHYPRKTGGAYLPCPWCGGDSKPKAYLNFYDRLYPEVEAKAKEEPLKPERLITSYVLRDGKNRVKSFYILRADSENTELKRSSENYFTLVNVGATYHLYNEFDKEGISVKSFATGTFRKLDKKGDIALNPGDEIYLGVVNNKEAPITCGGKHYRFIRVAKFVEDK